LAIKKIQTEAHSQLDMLLNEAYFIDTARNVSIGNAQILEGTRKNGTWIHKLGQSEEKN
jgi:hypothetical protein